MILSQNKHSVALKL